MLLAKWTLCALVVLCILETDILARSTNWTSFYVEQCMAKIIEVIQPCSQQAVSNWNLNHSLFVPSKLSTCCANWEVFDCFVQASLEYCNLFEFQALVQNMTTDALALQRSNCSRFKYHSEVCTMFNGASSHNKMILILHSSLAALTMAVFTLLP